MVWPQLPYRNELASMSEGREARVRRGIPLRAIAPNAVTALALCSGLTAIRFGIAGEWEKAVIATIIAGVLDGVDGRIARMLNAQSRFGAELDSLSDAIAFGVSPALVMYLWSLKDVPKFGWLFALALALCCALRLARFNAAIDVEDQPHKSAGYLTGVPAPAGAGLALLPVYLWLETGLPVFRDPALVAPWLALIAFLMISNVATFSWGSIRPRRNVRIEIILLFALVGSALFSVPWIMLSIVCIVYTALIPWGMIRYARVKRLRARAPISVT
jgi:CDP-diacylglycerol---serine O-phosphatidyltransferase